MSLNMDDMMKNLARALAGVKIPGNDKTQWHLLFPNCGAGANAWLQERKSDEDTVTRAATCALALQKQLIQIDDSTCPNMPLRWGSLAMDGLKPFLRLLHITTAHIKLREAGHFLSQGNFDEAKTCSGQAWRHLKCAGDWKHDAGLAPKSDIILNLARLAIDLLALQVFVRKATPTSVALCHLILHNDAATAQIKKRCQEILANMLMQGWVNERRDLRHGAIAPKATEVELEKYAATTAGLLMCHCKAEEISDVCARFVGVNTQAYGCDRYGYYEALEFYKCTAEGIWTD
jgi:hypothetical protein